MAVVVADMEISCQDSHITPQHPRNYFDLVNLHYIYPLALQDGPNRRPQGTMFGVAVRLKANRSACSVLGAAEHEMVENGVALI